MRTKPPAEDAATPSTRPGEKTVIHVGPDEISQRTPRQLQKRPLSLIDVIGYTVLASAILLGGFMALAFLVDRMRDWLEV
jgi:hypothetical protein